MLSCVMHKEVKCKAVIMLTVPCPGEDGRLAYEQLDKFPRDCVKVGGRHGTEVATAF